MNISKIFPEYSFKANRLINYEAGGLSKSVETENKQIKYVPFTGNPEQDINALAEATYPNAPDKQTTYAKKINDALNQNLREPAENSKNELWEYLGTQQCTAQAIVEGMLQFYKQVQDQPVVIKIGQYLKSIDDISSVADADVVNHTERLATYDRTKGELSSLLDEIKAANPVAFEKLGNKNA